MTPLLFDQLHPAGERVDALELLSGAGLSERAGVSRPYTVANFVASVDGRVSFAGRSAGLGDDGDHHLFHSLREISDAVLVGARTFTLEGYGRMSADPDRRARRVAAGRPAEPLACVMSSRGTLRPDTPIFAEPSAEVLVFTPATLELGAPRAHVQTVPPDPARSSLSSALGHLRQARGVRLLLCEGGPALLGALIRERLLDELFLTLAPALTGGGKADGLTSGPELPELARLRLRWVLGRRGSLFLRYAIEPGART